MGVESAIVARLNAVAGVTALVSNRIFADTLPDGETKPAVVYQVISTTFNGYIGGDSGIEQARVQLSLYADSKSETITLSNAVKAALKRYSGVVSDITIKDCAFETIGDLPYNLTTGETVRIVDLLITYEG